MTSEGKIKSVQLLRFFAALMVVFGHVMMEAYKMGIISTATYRLIDMFPWGAGVDLFFIISGFIIAHVLPRFSADHAGFIDFMVRRVIRIAPLYWFYTLLMIAAVAAFPSAIRNANMDPAHIAASLAFIPWQRPGDGALRPVLGQGWTLNYEMFFYLLAGACILISATRRELLLCAAVLVAVLFGRLLPQGPVAEFVGYTIMLEFVFGVALYRISRTWPPLPLPIGLGLLVGGLAAWLILESIIPDEWRGLGRGVPAFMVAAGFVLSDGLVKAESPRAQFYVLLGDASYSLYLSHTFIVIPLGIGWRKLGLGAPVAYVAIAIAAAFAGSIVSYLLIERPMTERLQGMWAARRAQARSPSAAG
jgi:peptidoglycan/LPS O-acetylase OafA/YrhL